jgi:16S rRNA processing protein RimM
MSTPRWVPFGRIGRPHGLTGEITVWPYNHGSANAASLRRVKVEPAGETFAVAGAKQLPRGVCLRLTGVGDRGAAQALCGKELWCRRQDWDDPPVGQYYAADLVGCRVEGLPDGLRGEVRAVIFPAGQALLVTVLTAPDQRQGQLEIPFVPAIARVVDVAAGSITVHLPDGLLELTQWT